MLVTDLDGTLLDPSGRVHASDRVAIAALHKRGIPVSICTGRMYSGTREIALEIGVTGPVACVDGGHLVEVRSNETLAMFALGAALSELLRTLLCATTLPCFAFSNDQVVHDDRGLPHVRFIRTWSPHTRFERRMLEPEVWGSLRNLVSIVMVGSRMELEGLLTSAALVAAGELQSALFPLRETERAGNWALILRRARIDKGTAVTWLAERHGVRLSDVVVVGDWVNDLPMFAVAGQSFAMAQAPSQVAEAATSRLRANVHLGGGIAEAAERAGLL